MTSSDSKGNSALGHRLLHAEFIPVLLLCVSFLACSHLVDFEGRYFAAAPKELGDFRIQFSFNDLNRKEMHKIVRLRKDGSFRFKIRAEGQYLLSASIVDFSKSKWKSPQISNGGSLLPIVIPKSGKLRLSDLFISEELQIVAPTRGQSISLQGDFNFVWNGNELARYYSLSLFTLKPSGERDPVITIFNILEPHLKLSEMLNTERVSSELTFNQVLERGMFIRQGSELKPDQYGLAISAYLVSEQHGQFITIARSAENWEIQLTD